MQNKHLSVSGIYPHLAAWNHGNDTNDEYYQEPECGIGAVVPWADKLWFITYTSHDLFEGDDKLYSIDKNMDVCICEESVGGTHAGRLIHKESEQLFIGCYVIDNAGRVRVIDRHKLPGRLTAIARHLNDPKNKVYYYSQECSLYEVDVHSLEVSLLFKKPVAGWHAKGAYTGQGVLVVAHNGEEIAPSPYWQAYYCEPQKTLKEVSRYLQTESTYGTDDMGVLAEWDGETWREICRHQFNDINSYGGLSADAPANAPIWAQGWDKKSVLIKVRSRDGWSTWRLPKGSFTYDGWNGSYTEWPRFVNIAAEKMLMIMHGTLFEWPVSFSADDPEGIKPHCTYQRIIPDISVWQDKLALAGQDTSRIGIPWTLPGHPHSNIQFTTLEEMRHWGPCSGFGDIWRNETVDSDEFSDPFLVNNYGKVCLHFVHTARKDIVFNIELFVDGKWTSKCTVKVSQDELKTISLKPQEESAQWLRVMPDKSCRCTVSLHLSSERNAQDNEAAIFSGLADIDNPNADYGILQVPVHNHNLQFLRSDNSYYEINDQLEFSAIEDASLVEYVDNTASIFEHVFEDNASFWAVGAEGQRYRFPKSSYGKSLKNCRDVREVVQERFLANISSTFYEVPRYGVDEPYEQRNLPDYRRMRPICSHNKAIADFIVWRGMLVLSGINNKVMNDGHVFCDATGSTGLWFGAFDDLWRLGKPVGIGGPWKDTPVAPGMPSDQYLMTGFSDKALVLSHNCRKSISFIIEIDINNTGNFHKFTTFLVKSGETINYKFPDGFHAHWLRVIPSAATVATAQLIYS